MCERSTSRDAGLESITDGGDVIQIACSAEASAIHTERNLEPSA